MGMTMITIRRELEKDAAAREALLDIGYGCARFGKVSHRLRKGRHPSAGLAFVACERDRIVGTVRLWDVATGDGCPALLLGPLTVDPEHRCRGVGSALVRRAVETAARLGHRSEEHTSELQSPCNLVCRLLLEKKKKKLNLFISLIKNKNQTNNII